VRQIRLTAVDVPFRGFVQILVKGLLDTRHISLFEHDSRKVRAAGQTASSALDFLDRDIDPQGTKPFRHPNIAVAPGRLHFRQPRAEAIGRLLIEEVSQQMDRLALKFRGEFDAAHQVEPLFAGPRQGLVVAGQGVVIGDRQCVKTGGHRGVD